MAHFTSIATGLSVEAEFKKLLTVEQFEQSNDHLDDLVSFSMFTHDWKGAEQWSDEVSELFDEVSQDARDGIWLLIDKIGEDKAKAVAAAMDAATGQDFGARIFASALSSWQYGRHPDDIAA